MGGASRVSQDGSGIALRLPVRGAQEVGGSPADERPAQSVAASQGHREESGARSASASGGA
jgi:hypothetical protein